MNDTYKKSGILLSLSFLAITYIHFYLLINVEMVYAFQFD